MYVPEDWRRLRISRQNHRINEEIRDKEVHLVSDTGGQLGIISTREALERAMNANLDLAKVFPTANPSVCKLMDYGKYKFEQTEREREARENQYIMETKRVRISPSINVSDFSVKPRNAQKFLTESNRVKITARFHSREMTHTDIDEGLLLKLAEQCDEVATLDRDSKLDGRHMSIFLSPKIAKEARKS